MNDTNKSKWFVLRTTYGREQKASEYLRLQHITVFCPTVSVTKLVDGKRHTSNVSRLPNLFFAYGTEEEIKHYVYDNVNLPYLRFYYRNSHIGQQRAKEPLTVPRAQMDSFRIICQAEANDTYLSSLAVQKFTTGELVRITQGKFSGVVGRVSRFMGQQRVGIVIDGLLTIATAYVPSAFLERIDADSKPY